MLRAQDIETLIYIASTEHTGRYETPDGFSVRFLPLGRGRAVRSSADPEALTPGVGTWRKW